MVTGSPNTCVNRVRYVLDDESPRFPAWRAEEYWEVLYGFVSRVRPRFRELALKSLGSEDTLLTQCDTVRVELPNGLEWTTKCIVCRFRLRPRTIVRPDHYVVVDRNGGMFFHIHDDSCRSHCRVLPLNKKRFIKEFQGFHREVVRSVFDTIASFLKDESDRRNERGNELFQFVQILHGIAIRFEQAS